VCIFNRLSALSIRLLIVLIRPVPAGLVRFASAVSTAFNRGSQIGVRTLEGTWVDSEAATEGYVEEVTLATVGGLRGAACRALADAEGARTNSAISDIKLVCEDESAMIGFLFFKSYAVYVI